MKLESLLSSARYLALVLPVFALFSTVHSGCSSTATGYYQYGYGGKPVSSGTVTPTPPPPECIPRPGGYGGYGGYGTDINCDDDGYYGR